MGDTFLMAQVAKLYYIDKVKQNEIAERFNLTPMLVSRLIRRAEEEGIVQFHVKSPYTMDLKLGKRIKDQYGLSECVVLSDDDHSTIHEKIGAFLSDYFLNILKEDSIIGISWGRTISSFARNLPFTNYEKCKVMQLSGGFFHETDYMITPSSILKMVSEKLNCQPIFLNAPLYISEEAKKFVLDDANNRQILERIQQSDINIIGASKLSAESTVSRVGVITDEDIQELTSKGAIGDIAGFFINEDGDQVEWSKSEQYVGVPLEDIQKARQVICVAGEAEKLNVIKAALKKHYFNVLITSQEMAYKLI